jgi:Ca2+/Na+ antiporter
MIILPGFLVLALLLACWPPIAASEGSPAFDFLFITGLAGGFSTNKINSTRIHRSLQILLVPIRFITRQLLFHNSAIPE